MLFVGDVHGKFDDYLSLIENHESSIQVGDFGAGFVPLPKINKTHRFIRGNHDNPYVCQESDNWIPDGTYEDNVFYLGGAYSIDQKFRTIGKDWWPDEELDYNSLQTLIDQFAQKKPTVVVTHDAPFEVSTHIFRATKNWRDRTSSALQAMFDTHKPSLWIHGHWHKSAKTTVHGCEFISLAELESIEINI